MTTVSPREAATAKLSEVQLREIYRLMALTRALDERWVALTRTGACGICASCQGHEGAQVASAYPLRPGVDWVLPYYRDIGVALTLGVTSYDFLLGAFGRAEDPASGGRQFPAHWSSRPLNIPTGSTVVGTQIVHAVGVALASKIRREDCVTVTYFGEGTTSQGDFHEALTFAGVHKLPVIFICENNGYAISTAQAKQMGVRDVAEKAAGYGFTGVVVDGMDVLAVYETMVAALGRARAGEGPTLIEAKVYRFGSHTDSDDDRAYRTAEEVATWRQRDPLVRLRKQLESAGLLQPGEAEEIGRSVQREVDQATAAAEAAAPPAAASIGDHIYG